MRMASCRRCGHSALTPGDYMMPRPSSMAEMQSPAFLEKVKQGPKVVMTVLPAVR